MVQQLCSLPFEYFSDDSLKQLLFPTLIAACFQNGDNAAILKQEMSTTLLSEFIDSAMVSVQVKNLLDKTTHNDNQTIGKTAPLPLQPPDCNLSLYSGQEVGIRNAIPEESME